MITYFVKLKPIDKYFFGGEIGFNTSKFKNDSDKKIYLIKSRYLPQQTSILGMMRYEILKEDENFIIKNDKYNNKDKEMMSKLIGKESFNINKSEQEFGKILKLSPIDLYIETSNEMIYKVPLDHNKDLENNKYCAMKLSNTLVKTNFGEINFFEDYKSKKGLSNDWVNKEKEIIKNEDIFKSISQVGIDINVKDNGFYKQTFIKLDDDYSFAFYIEVDDIKFTNGIVELGKERSSFVMTVEEVNEIKYDNKFGDSNKIYFASDVYLTKYQIDRINKISKFIINNIISFRNINRNENNRYEFKDVKNEFYERGSVIYLSDENKKEVINIIEENKNLMKIGYNIVF